MNAVAPGLGADIDHGKPNALRRGFEDALGIDQPDRHGIDENIVVVARIEIGLAADRRHAHAVAVIADAGDDAADKVPCLGMIGRAEPERIHVGDGARAHGEDIAHDAADAGRRPLIGLDVRGVVMALHLEHGGLAIAEIDHAGILAGTLDHLRTRRRQLLQPDARGFVGAMLRPHHREDAELGQRRLASELFQQAAIFVRVEPMLRDDLICDAVSPLGRSCRDVQLSVSTSERNILVPSVPPSAASARRSGCGISPSTVRVSL